MTSRRSRPVLTRIGIVTFFLLICIQKRGGLQTAVAFPENGELLIGNAEKDSRRLVGMNKGCSSHSTITVSECQHLLKGGYGLQGLRQNEILGELKRRGITNKEMCTILHTKYHEKINLPNLSAVLNGERADTPKGERVIRFIKHYLSM